LLACWRAARYADAGVVNRAFLAVALVGNACILAAVFEHSRVVFPLLILPIVCGVVAFLFFAIRQFDQLVERNG
jgi:hypothetical protein